MPKPFEKIPGGDAPKERKNAVLKLGESRARLAKKKSEYPGYTRVEVTFDDIYRSELVDAFHWDEDQVESFDLQLFTKLQAVGAIIDWEDNEFFKIDFPEVQGRDAVGVVEAALKEACTNPLAMTELEEQKISEKHSEIQEAAGELAAAEMAQVRVEENLFQAYKRTDKPTTFGHDGYCSMAKVKIKKAAGISYDDNEFLGRELRAEVTKPNMVIMKVTLNGEPFARVYGSKIFGRSEWSNYQSKLQGMIEALQTSPGDVIKFKHRITVTTGNGEEVKILCTDDFAKKVENHFKAMYADLDDISKKGKGEK